MTKTKLYTAIILGVAAIMVFSSIAPVLVADAGFQPGRPGLKLCPACVGVPGQITVAIDLEPDGTCDIGPFFIPVTAARAITGTCNFLT